MPDLPDFYSPFVVKGWTGTEYKTIKVGPDGEMYILLSALFEEGITGLQCDEFGNLRMNVKAQDLAEVINRPKYGAAEIVYGEPTIVADTVTTLATIDGKGIIYGGHVNFTDDVSRKADNIEIWVDGQQIGANTFEVLNRWSTNRQQILASYMIRYDDLAFMYACGLGPGITFESSYVLKYANNHATNAVDVGYHILHAIV